MTLGGSYSYVEVFGIDARLRITTTHARIKLLEVGGDMKAAAHIGVIDYLGDRGRIQLDPTGEIGEIKPEAPLQGSKEPSMQRLNVRFESCFRLDENHRLKG